MHWRGGEIGYINLNKIKRSKMLQNHNKKKQKTLFCETTCVKF